LGGEGDVSAITRALQTDDQTVTNELVAPHSGNAGNVFHPICERVCGGSQR
jgi:hypothetical protein